MNANAQERLAQDYRPELLSLQAVDDLVEGIVNALQSTGKLDDTVVIFTSDNGLLYGDHRLTGKIAAMRVPSGFLSSCGGPAFQRTKRARSSSTIWTSWPRSRSLQAWRPDSVPDGHTLTPLFLDVDAPWRSAILIEGNPDYRPRARRFFGGKDRDDEIRQIWWWL